MRTLSAAELLGVWEHGQRQHPLDRALTLLAATCPEKEREELMHLSIGQRDAMLLSLRQLTFGPQMEAYAACLACGAQFEFTINIDELLQIETPGDRSEPSADLDGFIIRFRLPDSVDLTECINSGSVEADKELLKRCVLKVKRGNKGVAFEELPEATISALASRMAELDPLSEVQIALNCTECGQRSTMLLDIFSFFWTELGERAKQLLNQVHVLARYYGWREADILAISPWRRQYYLDMVTQ
jgi:hypothetical protein